MSHTWTRAMIVVALLLQFSIGSAGRLLAESSFSAVIAVQDQSPNAPQDVTVRYLDGDGQIREATPLRPGRTFLINATAPAVVLYVASKSLGQDRMLKVVLPAGASAITIAAATGHTVIQPITAPATLPALNATAGNGANGIVDVLAVDATNELALAAGLRTCRVIVQFSGPDDNLLSAGFSNITTDDPAGFVQGPAALGGSNTAPLELFVAMFPELTYDSFVTVGLDLVAIGTTDCTTLDPDFDAGAFNTAGAVSGGWFCSNPPSGQGLAGNYADQQVLLAQFTVSDGFGVSGSQTVFSNDGSDPFPTTFECFVGLCQTDPECDDENACTVDQCTEGHCLYLPVDCNDGDPCTQDSCAPAGGGCQHQPLDCDDGDACSLDSCDPAGGNCQHFPITCDDGNPCTDDACDPAVGCLHEPNIESCDDGDSCSLDSCDPAGGNCQHFPITCDDGNPCTDDTCDPAVGCLHEPNAEPCDDGDACTIADHCAGGSCSGISNDCNDDLICTTDNCDPGTGACLHQAVDCDDNNPCTTDLCDPAAGCVHPPNRSPCDDGDSCTQDDVCAGGVCSGNSVDCNDGVNCTVDGCVNGNCLNVPNDALCANGQFCDGQEFCDPAGGCTPGIAPCPGVPCDEPSRTCQPPGCGANDQDCCAAGPDPACQTLDCCNLVCTMMPSCCEELWSGLCVSMALSLCGDLCNPSDSCSPGAGNCCQNNGTPGCDDLACCDMVCTLDPFCCDNAWDQICADSAFLLCPGCSKLPGDADCCIAHGGLGCADPECEALICGQDPFCCETAWDQICADAAVIQCDSCGAGGGGICPSGAAGDCCSANGSAGCDDPACCDAVCAADSFCCAMQWDGLCAGLAGELCAICSTACEVTCPPDGLDEGEPCGQDTNGGGCSSPPPAVTPAACGDTLCGTAWADAGTRDTDWYALEHPGGTVSATLTSAFDGVALIVDGLATCTPTVVGSVGCSSGCQPIETAAAELPAGVYAVFVAPGDCTAGGLFDGLPCGSGNNSYSVTIDCSGGCLTDDDCPAGERCSDGLCAPAPPANDACAAAVALAVPAEIDGSTMQAAPDNVPGASCGTAVSAPGVWYSVIGNGTTLTASTCNQADYDTKISVFCNGCDPREVAGSNCCTPNGGPGCDDPKCEAAVCAGDAFCCDTDWDGICADQAVALCPVCLASPGGALTCVGGLDDTVGCGGFTTEFSWCGNPGIEYLILVHGFGDAQGNFTLSVSTGAPCKAADGCLTACASDADCPAGAFCDGDACAPLPAGACCTCDGSDSACAILTALDCAAAGGTYLGDDSDCAAAGEQVTIGSSPNAMIPDSDPGGVGDTVAMGVSFAIQDLDVEVNINHTWVGDLCVMLSHNGGAPIELLRRPGLEPDTCEPGVCCGCSADNYSGTVLDDDRATGTIEASCTAGNTGRFTPNHPLSTFDGEDSAGNWTLQVSDGAADDLGTLISWALIFTPPPAGSTPCAQQVPCQCAGDADCDPGQRCVGGLCLETGACCLCQGSRCAGTVVATCTEGLTADQCGILGDYQGDGSVCLPDGCAGKCPECHDNADCADGICLDGRCTRPDSGDDDDDGGDLPGDDDDDNG